MPFFNKQEIIGILSILLLIIVVSYISYLAALGRGRDERRITDLDNLTRALQEYYKSFGTYPPSLETGKIIACVSDKEVVIPSELDELNNKYYFLLFGARECDWGTDPLADFSDSTSEAFLTNLPIDPSASKGRKYVYISNGEEFQLFTSLESQIKNNYDTGLEARNIDCGEAVCNFGKASPHTGLENVIDEYQNDIRDGLDI